jgi:tetratricopeptide (TPR) repeat protein/predicted Ser/Thr protein kinase
MSTPSVRVLQGQLGAYEVGKILGEGAMAQVFRARPQSGGDEVAVKVLQRSPDTQAMERFRQEARLGMELAHENLVRIRDYGQHQGLPFVVMDLVDGRSLESLLPRGQRADTAKAVEVVLALAQALDTAHTRGVIHRDVKPENVILSRRGDRPMLTDFGMAKDLTRGMDLTAEGVALGTPAYMSPEQAAAKRVDLRSDIYALGVILYRMLTGRLPHEGATAEETLRAVINDKPPRPSRLARDLDPELEGVVLKAMARHAEERYPTCAELVRDLQRYQKHQRKASSVAPQRSGPPPWAVVAAVGLVAAGVTFLVVALVVSGRRAAQRVAAEGEAAEAASAPDPLAEAEALFLAGDAEGALDIYSRLLVRDPSLVAARVGRARARLRLPDDVFDAGAVAADVAEALRAEPGHVGALQTEVRLHLRTGDLRLATEALARAKAAAAGTADEERTLILEDRLLGVREEEEHLAREVEGLLRETRTGRALEAALQAVERWPGSGRLRLALARVLAEQGRFAEAVERYGEVEELDPALARGDRERRQLLEQQARRGLGSEGELTWDPVFGGAWTERGSRLRGEGEGFGPFGLSVLLSPREPPGRQFSVSVQISLERQGDRPGGYAGITIGARDTSELYVVYAIHDPEQVQLMFQQQGQLDDLRTYREQRGSWPKLVRMARVIDGEWELVFQVLTEFPDQGWISLEVQVQNSDVTVVVNGQQIEPVQLGRTPDGRVGVHKWWDSSVEFRDLRVQTYR